MKKDNNLDKKKKVMSPYSSMLVKFFFLTVVVGYGAHFRTTSALCTDTRGRCPNGGSFFWDFIHGDCGYPDLTLNCSSIQRPTMLIGSNTLYYVLSVFSDQRIRIVGKDVYDQNCPQPRHNFTLPTTSVLSFTVRSNVTYFYNCSSGYPENVSQGLPCLDDATTTAAATSPQLRSFAFPSHYSDDIRYDDRFTWYARNCHKSVVVPVNFVTANTSDLTEIIKSGFNVRWRAPDECLACETSGGNCWYNQTAGVPQACSCSLDNTTSSRTVFHRACPAQTNNKTISRQQGIGSTQLKIILGACSAVGGLALFILFIYRQKISLLYNSIVSCWKSKIKSRTNMETFLESCGCPGLQRYKYPQVKKMTNAFKEKLGQGGFGSVYKGKLPGGRYVAVKVLNRSKGNGEDFMNEVATIGWTNHVNVVRLLGFCSNGNKQALVYEFMLNGSLEKFIYERKNVSTTNPSLGWEKLYQIALGIAKGLEYLHCGCNTRILHFDIKPHNILLDEDFCPKISDFGLAKLCQTRESNISLHVARGTAGYIAPEISCINFGKVSNKSDVYSYGMVIFEMIAGRKNIDVNAENLSEIYFPQWIYNHLKRDINLDETEKLFTEETTRKMIMVAFWCIQTKPSDRPSISKVVEMLEGSDDKLQMPPDPFQESSWSSP